MDLLDNLPRNALWSVLVPFAFHVQAEPLTASITQLNLAPASLHGWELQSSCNERQSRGRISTCGYHSDRFLPWIDVIAAGREPPMLLNGLGSPELADFKLSGWNVAEATFRLSPQKN